ncbi:MAG: sulfatase-like hydrolase/transferase, partial [bacterium]|nr:sulfatase-like hydrolase/transferase [bacterium]
MSSSDDRLNGSLDRRDLLRGACAGFAGLLSASAGRAAPPRPNIVFVLTDDLRWDGLGITGHPFAQTPHIDRLGREGAVFNNFFVTTPLCSPSRASFLTGKYAHSHRIINNDKNGLAGISHTLMSWPRLLRESGYETAFIGKWHMGFDDTRRPGFDDWLSFKAQGLFIDPVVNDNGRRRQLSGYMTDFLNQQATDFVRRDRDKPFVLFLSHKAVHFPYLPAKRHEQLYADASIRYPEVAPHDLEGKPALTRKVPRGDVLRLEGNTPEPQESRRGRGRTRDSIVLDQMRCMASVDEGIGMIRQALTDIGQLDDTLIVFASDNGYLLGEHGQFNQKRWAYEDSIRVP